MATSTQELLGPFLGQHSVPALAGVHGTIAFEGPRGKVYAEIDDGRVNLKTKSDRVDTRLKSDEEGVLLQLVRGEINAVVAALQGRIEGEGDMLLALEVAGSMQELGKRLADADQQTKGGA